MGKLEARENRRKSIVGGIIDAVPPAANRGRPKAEREVKKRVSLSVLPSLYEDMQKIAYVERRSVSELLCALMEGYRADHAAELMEYGKMQR